MSDPTEIISLESFPEYQQHVRNHRLLHSHYDEISKLGNISREQARQLVEISGENILNGRPINSFTNRPSKTNYDVAVEGIMANLSHYAWEAVRAAARFLLDLLKEVIAFLLNRLGLKKNPDKAAQEVQALLDFRMKVEPLGTAVMDTHPKVTGELSKLQSLESRYAATYTSLTHDLLTNGQYGQMASHLEMFLLEKIDTVSVLCELFESVMVEFSHGSAYVEKQHSKITDSLNTILKPINTNPLPSLVHKSGFRLDKIGTHSSYFEIVRAVAEYYSDARASPYGEKALSAQEAATAIADRRIVQNCPKVLNGKESVKKLEKCKESLKSALDSLTQHSLPEDINELVMDAWKTLRENVTAVANTKQITEGILAEAERVSALVLEWSIQNGKVIKIKAELADPGNHDTVQEEMRELQKKIGNG